MYLVDTLLLQRERRVKLTHGLYLIRGSVGASALFLPIRREDLKKMKWRSIHKGVHSAVHDSITS